ncbi:hypothetical protein SLEP1_g38691 [Rubroshorea leprosula]|uniref:Transmembrane protein n=1 Tax=Rubroshorea leprosula TaxID=152421 RepID=A0AAV5KY59_9ROSI|nr:hypothetical protein SLEP1_g38691 [Rubroshorea leprosula]
MNGEEAGPPGPKVLRLLLFVGSGFLFTVAINRWREMERRSIQKQEQHEKVTVSESSANAVTKAIK